MAPLPGCVWASKELSVGCQSGTPNARQQPLGMDAAPRWIAHFPNQVQPLGIGDGFQIVHRGLVAA